MGAGLVYTLAALPEAESPRLLAVTRAWVEARVALSRAASGPDAALVEREAIASGIETLDSLARLWPTALPEVAAETEQLRHAMPPAPTATDLRVPVRNPAIVGPLNVYYYDYFADIPGADLSKTALAAREDGDVLAYEALNLADGQRSVSEIRDVLAGRYAPVPLPAIAEYFDFLLKTGAVTLR